MYANNPLILELIALLKKFEIRKIVVSPGSRHRPFVASIEQDDYFELFSVVDERGAAFFAIGLIQECNEPVAITCSSGTACMNYGSAIVEAYYQKLPLLVLSSDRNPVFLNQGEDQMYDQASTFIGCTKYHAQLPIIHNDTDRWYCNRLINEGLISLTTHGKGPVHLNIPVVSHHADSINIEELPDVRKINYHTLTLSLKWQDFANKLDGKKIAIVWGQSVHHSNALTKAIDKFAKKSGAVILTDRMSNCNSAYALTNTLLALKAIKPTETDSMMPDIVISIGGNYIFNNELKSFLKQGNMINWQVGEDVNICDPFWCLTDKFNMTEIDFFESLADTIIPTQDSTFRSNWLQFENLPHPSLEEFNEIYPIGRLIQSLPDNCDLQLANSNTIRFAHYFNIKSSIRVNCNRGVNGIDGSMSTAMGFSAINKKPTFYITGELSFFYDMNALWIKYRSANLRILLVNNNGGAVMYDLHTHPTDNKYPIYLATGHDAVAKGWAESQGFRYIAAHNKSEVDEGIAILTDPKQEKPIILEVFTDYDSDGTAANKFFASLDRRSFIDKVHGRLNRMANNLFKK